MECNNNRLQWSGTGLGHFYLPSSLFSHYWSSLIYPDACLFPSLKHPIVSLSHSHNFPQISHKKFACALKTHGNLAPPSLSVTKFRLKLLKALSGSCDDPSIINVRALVFGIVSIFSCSFGVLCLGFFIYCFSSCLLSQSFMLNSPLPDILTKQIASQSSQGYFAVFSNRRSEDLAGAGVGQEMAVFNFTLVWILD